MPDLRLERAGGVLTLVIDRPSALNAIGLGTMAELDEALREAARSEARVVVVRGAGERAFVSGGDLKELESLRTEREGSELASRMRAILDRLSALPQPVICALNGDAYGGGAELAVAGDFRVAAEHARLGFTQVRLGIMPAWGGIERLQELVGRARALYLLTTGEVLSAAEAERWGLVEAVWPSLEFAARLDRLAAAVAEAPAAALAAMKAALDA
ncbi:MAG TPA: enoyl-CoA hydratase/isomerase family protein, partial [Candidatus Acidoferrales bacterium]|nr:enoyl-CoA hydratase/isomerase family protein [Candidatus Acidoferrales bacterium]